MTSFWGDTLPMRILDWLADNLIPWVVVVIFFALPFFFLFGMAATYYRYIGTVITTPENFIKACQEQGIDDKQCYLLYDRLKE